MTQLSMSTDCHTRWAAAAVLVAALTACAPPATEHTVVVVETVTAVADVPPPAPLPQAAAPAPGAKTGLEGFDEFAKRLPAQVGLAVVPIGGGQSFTGGTLATGAAWSTIKVPLAIAALTADPSQLTHATAAITASDNQAAQAMWDSLGGGASAATQVQRILAQLGDPTTAVQPAVTRPGYSAFGQTQWTLSAQAQFTAMLPCNTGSSTVLALMGRVSEGQSWGIGSLPGAQFKGGWGPDGSGNYLVRQMGIVNTRTGKIAIAVAAAPKSGTFDGGTAVLDQIATWLSTKLPTLPGATHC